MPMQIRRTATPNNPPTGLAAGQLSVEMASQPPRLWCGVPTSIDAAGRIALGGGATAAHSLVAPTNPRVGELWFNVEDLTLYVYYQDPNSAQWCPTINQGLPDLSAFALRSELVPERPTVIAPNPPGSPQVGDQWYNTQTGELNIWNGSAWVLSTQPLTGFLPLSGGALSGGLWCAANIDIGGNFITRRPGIDGGFIGSWSVAMNNNLGIYNGSGLLNLGAADGFGNVMWWFARFSPGGMFQLFSQPQAGNVGLLFECNSGGNVWARGTITSPSGLQAGSITVTDSGVVKYLSWMTGWHQAFDAGTGTLVWVGTPAGNLMSLNGAGALWTLGTFTASSTITAGGAGFVMGSVNLQDAVTDKYLIWMPGWYNSIRAADGLRQWIGAPGTLMYLDGAGNFVAMGAITPGSDAAFKEDITDYADEIDLARLRPRYFRRKGKAKRELGFIHQELAEIAAELAPINQNIKCMDPVAILAAVVAQCQKLTERVRVLEQRGDA